MDKLYSSSIQESLWKEKAQIDPQILYIYYQSLCQNVTLRRV